MFQHICEWEILLKTLFNSESGKFSKSTFFFFLLKTVQIIFWPTWNINIVVFCFIQTISWHTLSFPSESPWVIKEQYPCKLIEDRTWSAISWVDLCLPVSTVCYSADGWIVLTYAYSSSDVHTNFAVEIARKHIFFNIFSQLQFYGKPG